MPAAPCRPCRHGTCRPAKHRKRPSPPRTKPSASSGISIRNAACGPILEKCCTQRLLRKLRADYGYDGEGYAVWLFRTGAQDGPDDVSEIREVASLGDGRYRVDFVDMGTEGRRIVKIVDENGAMKIDAVE